MTSEGDWPKNSGDIFYASDCNYTSGNIIQAQCGEAIPTGSLVYFNGSLGSIFLSDLNTADDIRSHGIALAAGTNGSIIDIVVRGKYKTTGLTAGKMYYLGVNGSLTTTKNGVQIGTATTTTNLFLNIVQDDRDTIGAVKAYMKSFTGIPGSNVCAYWVECNGQSLSDAESPLNGSVIPNLNGSSGGTQRFLRGATTSGTTGGADSISLTHDVAGPPPSHWATASGNNSYSTHTFDPKAPYYEVLWLFKIK